MLYEQLYARAGYHANSSTTHAEAAVRLLSDMGTFSVLDVGCSHGRGVELLWRSGHVAAGVDVSATAVRRALELRRNHPNCGPHPCFSVGGLSKVMRLPFADSSFDAVMSTDVLEHVAPGEVDAAIDELGRVTRRVMVLQIATATEKHTRALNTLHRAHTFEEVTTLHATIQPLAWWRARFATRLHANVSITSKRLILVRMPHEHADEQQTELRGTATAWRRYLYHASPSRVLRGAAGFPGPCRVGLGCFRVSSWSGSVSILRCGVTQQAEPSKVPHF